MLSKYKLPIITVFLVLFIDQCIKLYIKSHYPIGEVCRVFGDWFRITFTENPGMAFGLEFGGNYGKLALSLFRIIAVFGGVFYIRKIVNDGEHKGFIVCVSLVLAGALGNIIDSAFYGLIFDRGMTMNPMIGWEEYSGVAQFSTHGYTGFLHGHVVDMFYFPIFHGTFPDWVPFWGGEEFEFFSAIFNFADAAISVGVVLILLFQRKFFKKIPKTDTHESTPGHTGTETPPVV
ncbi:MAG: lipoprotein signal peptidase [Bacteroidetes bacterium]|nr:lipoprotein signal peptidase [Bacteroidota bacterium]